MRAAEKRPLRTALPGKAGGDLAGRSLAAMALGGGQARGRLHLTHRVPGSSRRAGGPVDGLVTTKPVCISPNPTKIGRATYRKLFLDLQVTINKILHSSEMRVSTAFSAKGQAAEFEASQAVPGGAFVAPDRQAGLRPSQGAFPGEGNGHTCPVSPQGGGHAGSVSPARPACATGRWPWAGPVCLQARSACVLREL